MSIVSDTQEYLEPFNFVELFEIDLFNYLAVCKQITDV